MKKYLELLKKYYCYVIAILVIILLIITWGNRIKTIDTSITKELANKEAKIEQLEEKISSLEYEAERQRMIASDWYNMWHEERFTNEWLWEFYYDNVCDINDENCKSGVYE